MLGCAYLLIGGLTACQRSAIPPAEQFQFPMAVYLQSQPNDFWEAFERGLRSRLNLPGMSVEVTYFKPHQREALHAQMADPQRWSAVAVCTAPDEGAVATLNMVIEAGIPVVVVGVDVAKAPRSGFVGTDYYDAGYRAGKWYARRLRTGRVLVIGNHPVPGATSELWEGFRHGLLFNKRVRAQLITSWETEKLRAALQRAKGDPTLKGVFVFGSDTAELALTMAPLPNLGVMGWREEHRRWFGASQCDLVILEKPEAIGVSVGNLMRNLSAGRGEDFRGLFIPVEWLSR